MKAGQSQLGDKLGPRLSALMTEATVAARAKLAPHEARIHQAATQALIDRAGHEVADLYRPLVHRALALHGEASHPIAEEFLRSAASGEEQLKAIGGFLMGASQGAISTFLNNYLSPAIYEIVRTAPSLHLDQNTSAVAVAKGLLTFDHGNYNANGFGYDTGSFQTLVDLARVTPSATDIQNLMNRGLLPADDGLKWMIRAGYPQDIANAIMNLRFTPLTPAILADMVVRGIRDQKSAANEAFQSGVSAEQFNQMVLDTGAPPSITDLSLAFRRGFIHKDRFVKGIRQSRVRNEWVDVLENVQYVPISVADAVTAHVQNYMTLQDVYDVAKVNGLESKYVQTLVDTAGEPISKTEVIELYRRGKIDKPKAEQAIREGRLKDKYIPDVFELARRVPPAREVATLYSHGALTADQADKLLAESGYDAEVQKAFLASALHGKIAAVKEVTLGDASRLYLEQAISWSEVEKLLKPAGYGPVELGYVKDMLDQEIIYRNRNAAISKTHTLYVGYKIDRTQASNDLDALHVQSQQRDSLLALWDIQRESNYKHLTEAQIADAYEYNLITPQQGVTMLMEIGYPRESAILVLEIKAKGPIKGLSGTSA